MTTDGCVVYVQFSICPCLPTFLSTDPSKTFLHFSGDCTFNRGGMSAGRKQKRKQNIILFYFFFINTLLFPASYHIISYHVVSYIYLTNNHSLFLSICPAHTYKSTTRNNIFYINTNTSHYSLEIKSQVLYNLLNFHWLK